MNISFNVAVAAFKSGFTEHASEFKNKSIFQNNGLSGKISFPALVAFYMLDLSGADSG